MNRDLLVLLTVLGLVLVSMPIYAWTGLHRKEDPLESSSRGKFVLGPFVKSWFFWVVTPLVRGSLALGLSPTFFNLLGVAFGVAAGFAFANGAMSVGGWAVLLGGAADILDGRIARAQGVAGPRGAFLDSTLDRFAELSAFVGVAVWFGIESDLVGVTAVTTALGGSLIVSYARARGEVEGVLCTAGVMQRAERLLILGFGGLLDAALASRIGAGTPGGFLKWAVVVIALGTVGTAVYRTVWITRRLPVPGDD